MTQRENSITHDILDRKKRDDIYIIAHYYQRDEIQDIADFVTLDKILYSLEHKQTPVTVPEEIRQKATKALEAMISLAS
jgi:quinolinate synthase